MKEIKSYFAVNVTCLCSQFLVLLKNTYIAKINITLPNRYAVIVTAKYIYLPIHLLFYLEFEVSKYSVRTEILFNLNVRMHFNLV